MSTITPDLQYFLSLDSAQWQFMLDSHAIHLVLVTATDSLTLTRNLIATIRDTRNKKQRRKYITEFMLLLAGVVLGGNYGDALGDLMCIFKLHYNYAKPDTVAYIRSNETGHGVSSAYQIGDSKHYTSCLRSGIQRSKINLSGLTDKDFNTENLYESSVIVEHRGGEYDDCIPNCEVTAFMNGEIQYCVVGKLYTEGGDGYLGRYRIHRGELAGASTGKKIYVLSDYYGDVSCRVTILTKILEHYGVGNVYVTGNYDYVTSKHPVSTTIDNEDVYMDDVDVYDNYILLTPYTPKPYVTRTRTLRSDVPNYNQLIVQGYSYKLKKPVVRPTLKEPRQSHNKLPLNTDYRTTHTYVGRTDSPNVNELLELVTTITGNKYYTLRNSRCTEVYTDPVPLPRCHNSYYDTTGPLVHFEYGTPKVCISLNLTCGLSWRCGIAINYNGTLVCIKGNKNVRKAIKLGLLNIINSRFKTKYEVLHLPSMSET